MALPNSKILIHQVSGGFQGQATDIEIHAKEIIDVRQRLDKIIAQHTGQDLEKCREGHRARLLHERRGSGGVLHRRPCARAALDRSHFFSARLYSRAPCLRRARPGHLEGRGIRGVPLVGRAGEAFFAGSDEATLRYAFHSSGEPRRVTVRVVDPRTGEVFARWTRDQARPGKLYKRPWSGATKGSGSAPDGRYAFRISSPGHRDYPGGTFRLRNYKYPVPAPHGTRGPIGEFGAPRSAAGSTRAST